MKYEDMQVLANIYNTLLGVKTSGEDTYAMADAMRALYKFIDAKQKEYVENQQAENKEA